MYSNNQALQPSQHHQDDSPARGGGDYGRHTAEAHRAQLQQQSQPPQSQQQQPHHHSHQQPHQPFAGLHSNSEHQPYGTLPALGGAGGGGGGGAPGGRSQPLQQYYSQAPEAAYSAQPQPQQQQPHHTGYMAASPYAYNSSSSSFGAYAPSQAQHSSVFPNSAGTGSSADFDHHQQQQQHPQSQHTGPYEAQGAGYDYGRSVPSLNAMYGRPAVPSLPMMMGGPDLSHHHHQQSQQGQQHFQPLHMQQSLAGPSSMLHPSQQQQQHQQSQQASRSLAPQPITPLHAALSQQPTYIGYIKTATDAILLLSACDLPRPPTGSRNAPPPQAVTRRLLDSERATLICSGSVFAWDEKKAGMRRWTDGKCWSASRVSGCFLTYRELEVRKKTSTNTANGTTVSTSNQYKLDGLIKQSFTITTRSGRKLHVISYFTKRDIREGRLRRVSEDPRFVGEGGGEWGLSVDEEEFRDPSLREGPGTDVPVSARPPRVTPASRASGAVAAAAAAAIAKQEATSNDAVSPASSSRQSGSVGQASSSHGNVQQRLHLTSNLPPLHHHHLVGGGPGDIPSPPTTGTGGSTATDAPIVASPFAGQRGSIGGGFATQQQQPQNGDQTQQHRNGLQGGNAMALVGRSLSGEACAPVQPPFKRTLSDSSDEGAGAMAPVRRPKLARMRSGSWSGLAPSSSASNADYTSASETRMSSFRSSTSAATTVPSSSPGHGSFPKLGETSFVVAPPQGQEEQDSAVGALLSLRMPNHTSPTLLPAQTCSSAPSSMPNSPASNFATLTSTDSTTKGAASSSTMPEALSLPLRSNSDRSALSKFSVRV